MPALPDQHRLQPLLRTVILSAIGLFFAYDFVESYWLTEMGSAQLHLFREIRAVIMCLIVTGGTIAAASWHRPSPFPSNRGTMASWQVTPLVQLADWFLWMRWLACSTAVVLILVTVEVSHLLPRKLLLPLLGCVAFLALTNLLFMRLVNRQETLSLQVSLQVLGDLGTLTVLLHFSGGIENPLSLLYLFHVIISGIIFSRRQCYLVAAVAFGMFAVLASFEFLDIIPHYTLGIFPHADHGMAGGGDSHAAHHGPFVISRILLQGLILIITGYFITTIMARLRRRELDARDLAIREGLARERLESVVDAAGAGLRLLDSKLRFTWTNAKFHQWAPDEDTALASAAQTLADGKMRSSEHQIEGPDGRSRYYATTTAAMIGESDHPSHVVQLVQDVTARKNAEAEAIHAGKLAAVGELAGNLAHEINNPLGILSARLHLLLKKGELAPEKIADDLRKMSGLVNRISGITRSLLGHVRPSTRERNPLRLEPLFERAARLVETWASKKNIRITRMVDGGTPSILGSAGELEQVLVNLLLNAVDASPFDEVIAMCATKVTLDCGREALQLTVEDAGTGVPEALRPRIFEPFFSTKKSGEGTGLGLSLSKRIVDDHGGTIRVEQGRVGARFVVEIPALSRDA